MNLMNNLINTIDTVMFYMYTDFKLGLSEV